MAKRPEDSPVGLLLSGGLDSCVLLAWLLGEGRRVQPFYVRCGLAWEDEELRAVDAFSAALQPADVRPLVVFDQPVRDLYGPHWSVTGRDVPQSDTADDAVYLPGRNALLLIKPSLWCAERGIARLALAVLGSNPFGDASEAFFRDYAAAIGQATGSPIEFIRPFGQWCKCEVLRFGRNLPLERSFSCIAPLDGLHCGACNKCAERKAAFASAKLEDRTVYANGECRKTNV
jgi:7-cyano-7-deazaguanine synthase